VGALLERSAAHGHSLEAGHLLALAHVFARPIVCVASAKLEYRDAAMQPTAAAAAGVRLSGLYLPHCIPPAECASRDPLVVAYTKGHFSALVPPEAAAGDAIWRAIQLPPPAGGVPSVPLPLTDETRAPLPVLFAPADGHVGAAAGAVDELAEWELVGGEGDAKGGGGCGGGGGSADQCNGAGAPASGAADSERAAAARVVAQVAPYLDAAIARAGVDEGELVPLRREASVPVAVLRCPARVDGGHAQPADAYYGADWRQRLAAIV